MKRKKKRLKSSVKAKETTGSGRCGLNFFIVLSVHGFICSHKSLCYQFVFFAFTLDFNLFSPLIHPFIHPFSPFSFHFIVVVVVAHAAGIKRWLALVAPTPGLLC